MSVHPLCLLFLFAAQAPDFDGERVNAPLADPTDDVGPHAVSPDLRWLVYKAHSEVDNRDGLFRVPLDRPGSARRMSVASSDGVGVVRFAFLPNSRAVVYDSGYHRIFSAPLDLGPATLLADFGTRTVSTQLFPSPDSRHLLFTGPVNNARSELFSVPVDGSQGFVSISGPMVAGVFPNVGGNAGPPTFVGQRALYVADQEVDEQFSLYSVPIDGSAPKVRLNPLPVPGGDVSGWKLSPDGTRAVMSGDFQNDDEFELWSVPVDGSSAAIQISPALVPGGDVHFAFQLIGQDVVYLADQETDGIHELYRVPIDGSAPSVKLSQTTLAAPGIRRGSLVCSATRAVYLLEAPAASAQLFSVPLDGSAAPVALNGPLVANGAVLGEYLSPDGGRVVYFADQVTDEVIELWSVPTDGSAAALRLNGPLVAGGNVTSLPEGRWATKDGRLVYLADAEVDGRFELYFVSLEGSAAPIKLNPPLVAGGNVQTDVEIAPDDEHVVFRADAFTLDRFVLLSATLTATPVVDIENDPLPAGGDVTVFTVSGSNRILYYADQLTDNAFELFQSRFRRPNWRP